MVEIENSASIQQKIQSFLSNNMDTYTQTSYLNITSHNPARARNSEVLISATMYWETNIFLVIFSIACDFSIGGCFA